jgi:hypothetical protein
VPQSLKLGVRSTRLEVNRCVHVHLVLVAVQNSDTTIAISRYFSSKAIFARSAPNNAFHPSAIEGECKSIRSTVLSLPPQRWRIASTSSRGSAMSSGLYGTRGISVLPGTFD